MHIRTVLGDIPPGEMGITACHEHLLWVVPEPYAGEDPDLGFDSVPAAVDELRHFKRLGGAALVEMTTAEIGRHPQGLAQISRAAGVHVIAAAGHHKAKFSAAALEGQTVEQIAARTGERDLTALSDCLIVDGDSAVNCRHAQGHEWGASAG